MHKATARTLKLPTSTFTGTRQLSSTAQRHGIFSSIGITSDKNDPMDSSKQESDTIAQAKNDEGNTPAQQHASVMGHPVNEGSGNPQPSSSQPKKHSPGLGSKHVEKGELPGEEAVNPAVKGG